MKIDEYSINCSGFVYDISPDSFVYFEEGKNQNGIYSFLILKADMQEDNITLWALFGFRDNEYRAKIDLNDSFDIPKQNKLWNIIPWGNLTEEPTSLIEEQKS